MHLTSILTIAANLVVAALANTCNQDNCYRALQHYQQTSSSSFCSQYLKTSTKTAPSGIATCGPSRISSACSCLTTTTNPPPPITTTSTFATSTCTGRLLSTPGCPTPYDRCCRYVCAEAQVPYDVCSFTDGSGMYAVCTSCPSPTPT